MKTPKEIAVEAAKKSDKEYTNVENFIPHDWVLEAMKVYANQEVFNEFTRGYICAIANMLRLQDGSPHPIPEAFRACAGKLSVRELMVIGVSDDDLEEIVRHRKRLYTK